MTPNRLLAEADVNPDTASPETLRVAEVASAEIATARRELALTRDMIVKLRPGDLRAVRLALAYGAGASKLRELLGV
jgi:hypothetical protein